MMNHRYRLYGLRVDSFLPCPDLADGDGPADVEIRQGHVADDLPDATKRGVLFQAAPGRFRLAIDGVARYLVTEGREIIIDPAEGADEASVRVFLLGSAIGALLHQRGFLPLHASAVEASGRAIAFTGVSGRGKSTLAAAFSRAGYRVLADDVCAVKIGADGVPRAFPAYPGLRLWADAIRKLDIDPEGLTRARPLLQKSILPTGRALEQHPLPLSHVYLLSTSNQDRLELEPVEGMRKLRVLTDNTYRRQFLEGLGDKQDHFRLCVAVSRCAKVTQVIRPGAGFKLDELQRLIEADFTGVELPV